MSWNVQDRPKPLRVHGVGSSPSEAKCDIVLPIAIRDDDGSATLGNVSMPVVENSDIPGLLGITTLKDKRTLIDLNTNKVYFVGPGDYNMSAALPPGTECFQCELSPSGHLILPCCAYDGARESTDGPLTLLNGQQEEAKTHDERPVGRESGSSAQSSE